jgi:hypothetical protein
MSHRTYLEGLEAYRNLREEDKYGYKDCNTFILENMLMRTQGYVEKRDGKAIWVNGERYSAFAETQVHVNTGDYVDFEYTEKNSVSARTGAPVVYKNIKGNIYPRGGVPTSPPTPTGASPMPYVPPMPTSASKIGVPILDTQRLILRQNALTAAVNFANIRYPECDSSFIVTIAKQFEDYTSGDGDLKEAEESLKGISET